MKTKMKRQGSTELPHFAMGALAIAGASAANGATVQITFNNSYISSTSGNNLIADFGNDGTAEIRGQNGGVFAPEQSVRVIGGPLSAVLGQGYWYFDTGGGGTSVVATVGGLRMSRGNAGSVDVRGLVSISFSDANIRSGAQTTGYLDMIAAATYGGECRVTVNRLIFDDASTTAPGGVAYTDAAYPEWGAVPEPSSLGLLALGAGGLLARRRRAKQAA